MSSILARSSPRLLQFRTFNATASTCACSSTAAAPTATARRAMASRATAAATCSTFAAAAASVTFGTSTPSLTGQRRFQSRGGASGQKDLYQALGVGRKATQDEIRKAYLKKAKQLHPDVNPSPKAAEEFAEVQQANEILSDPQKRSQYDMTGSSSAAGGFPGGNPFAGGAAGMGNPFAAGGSANPFAGFGGPGAGGAPGGFAYEEFEKIFSKMAGGDRGGAAGAEKAKKPQGPEPGADIHFKLKLTFMEAVSGATKEISYNTVRKCVSCTGNGFKDAAEKAQCPQCNGRGKKVVSTGFFHMQQDCANCGGTGELGRSQCGACTGKGVTKDRAVQNLPVPKGINNKERLKIVGKGEAGVRNGPPGNLYVEISVDDHPIFHRDGVDIHLVAPVPLSHAINGGPLRIPTLTGEIETKVPAGTLQGDRVVLRGRGVHRPTQQKQGDLYVHFAVMLPKELTENQKAAIAQFAKDEKPINLTDSQLQELKGRYKSWFAA